MEAENWITSPYDYRALPFGETLAGNGCQVQLAGKWYYDGEKTMEGGYIGLQSKVKRFSTDELTIYELDEFKTPYSYQVNYQMKGISAGIVIGRQFYLGRRITMDFHCGLEAMHYSAYERLEDTIGPKAEFLNGIRKYKKTKPVVNLGFTMGYRF